MVKQKKREMPSSSNLPCVLQLGAPGSEMPHVAFANLRLDPPDLKAVDHFRHQCLRWPGLLIPEENLDNLDFGEYLEVVLPLQEWLRSAWKDDDPIALEYLKEAGAGEMQAKWEFRKGRIELTSKYLWNAICVLFLRDYGQRLTAVCAKPDCPAPFFIKARRSQKFCGTACADWGRKQVALRSWNKHQQEWRPKRTKARKMKGQKP